MVFRKPRLCRVGLVAIFTLHHVQRAAGRPSWQPLCRVAVFARFPLIFISWLLLSVTQVEKVTVANGAFKLGKKKKTEVKICG